jgi:hypothetical protein
MPAEGIERVVEATMAAPNWNPRPLDHGTLREMLKTAWEGGAPPL